MPAIRLKPKGGPENLNEGIKTAGMLLGALAGLALIIYIVVVLITGGGVRGGGGDGACGQVGIAQDVYHSTLRDVEDPSSDGGTQITDEEEVRVRMAVDAVTQAIRDAGAAGC